MEYLYEIIFTSDCFYNGCKPIRVRWERLGIGQALYVEKFLE